MKNKRFIAILTAVTCCMGAACILGTAMANDVSATAASTVKGDANCDGTVNMADAVLIMQALASPNRFGENGTEQLHLTAQGRANADTDGDGLTVGDAQAIQKKLLGIKETVDAKYGKELVWYPSSDDYKNVAWNDDILKAVVTNTAELKAYLEPLYYEHIVSKYLSKYDESYFGENVLLLKTIPQGAGSDRPLYGIGDITFSDSTIDICIEDYVRKHGEDDMFSVCFAQIAVSKSEYKGQTVNWNKKYVPFDEEELRQALQSQEEGLSSVDGVPVSYELYDLLNKNTDPNTVFSVVPGFKLDYDYEYKGMTIQKYIDERDENSHLFDKLIQLDKEGTKLKYGEALYTTGDGNGEIWDKSLYEERVAFYGEDFLAKYIVDGKFLREKVEEDIAKFDYAPQDNLSEAIKAYYHDMKQSSVQKLKEQNISYEYDEAADELVINVTETELKALSLDNISSYGLKTPPVTTDGEPFATQPAIVVMESHECY